MFLEGDYSRELGEKDLLAILQKSLDRALFLYNFMHSKIIELHHNIVRFRFFPRIAKSSITYR